MSGNRRGCALPSRSARLTLTTACSRRAMRVADAERSADTSLTTQCKPWERLMGPKRAESASASRARQSLLCALIVLTAAAPAKGQGPIPGTTIPCAPVSERAGRELGCWVLGHEVVGQLPAQPV